MGESMPQTGERTAFEEAREQFARELLPFPPLPECFTGRLLPFGDHISSFGGSGWGWARTGKGESSWRDEQDVVGGVTKAVAALFAGTG